MEFQGKNLEAIDWDDLLRLVKEQVPESETLDYKQELLSSGDSARKELLADVSAMANSSGGVLLYGISEARDADGGKTDLPEALVGIPGTNAPQEQQRLEQIIRAGLDPPLTRAIVRPIFCPDRSNYVMAVGVPSSLLAPHAVATATTMPFWRRAGSSRFALRTSELRRAFHERGAWEEEVEDFRARRIVLLRSVPPRHPVGTVSGQPAFLLHVLPLGRLREWIDIVPHWDFLQKRLNFGSSLHESRVNFEGILRTRWGDEPTRFVQWFRFGGVEAFTATLGGTAANRIDNKLTLDVTRPTILAVDYTLEAMRVFDMTFRVGPPYAVLLSISMFAIGSSRRYASSGENFRRTNRGTTSLNPTCFFRPCSSRRCRTFKR